jgi:hypothetical protein
MAITISLSKTTVLIQFLVYLLAGTGIVCQTYMKKAD